jgi:hypothetical protein
LAYYSSRKLTFDMAIPDFSSGIKINIGDHWRPINFTFTNIADVWKQIVNISIAILDIATWEVIADLTWGYLESETWEYQANQWKELHERKN